MKVTLYIENPRQSKTVDIDTELTIGRTPAAQLVVDDEGLSRINTTFFIEADELLVTDENSTNGTFLNGERISGPPRRVRNGDRLKIGSSTDIRVELSDGRAVVPESEVIRSASPAPFLPPPAAMVPSPESPEDKPPYVLIAAIAMTLLILVFGGIAFWIASTGNGEGPKGASRTPATSGSRIPVRVIDPLGGEDENDLDDLIASWETAEDELKAENVADVSVTSTETDDAELNVTAAFLADRQRKAFEERPGEKGIRPAGLIVPRELFGDGVIKQKMKLAAMNSSGYRQPMDFAELAEKRINRELLEMPMAAQSFYLDVGGSAQDRPFSSFSFAEGNQEILGGSPKYGILSRLAGDFAGQRYDLNNPSDRKQMRMRLLRMFHPNAKPILKKLADAYFQKFGRPLRVTSLTRSMDYQILLNSSNANSFKVRGEGSLPPHTSGCAFDLARKHMPVEEQNFVMAKLAEMERAGELDALIEYGANACFHVFIYHDGVAPGR
ncbi:MAG: FHA domain-containing protein [Acidobacteriota bacterium]